MAQTYAVVTTIKAGVTMPGTIQRVPLVTTDKAMAVQCAKDRLTDLIDELEGVPRGGEGWNEPTPAVWAVVEPVTEKVLADIYVIQAGWEE